MNIRFGMVILVLFFGITLQAQAGVWQEYTDPIDDSLRFFCTPTTVLGSSGLTPFLSFTATNDGCLVAILWGKVANGPQTSIVYRFPEKEPINSVWVTQSNKFGAYAPPEIDDILGSESTRFLACMLVSGDVTVRVFLDNGTWFTATFPTSKFSAFAYAFKERLRFGMLLSQPTQ